MSTVSRRYFLYAMGVFGACAGLKLTGQDRNDRLPKLAETRMMMGTFMTITARNESRALMAEALKHAFSAAESAEKMFTRHDATAPLGVLNTQGAVHDAPRPVIALLKDALHLATQTKGAFNPATVPVLDALAAGGVASIKALPASVQTDLNVLADPRNVIVRGDSIRLAQTGMGVSLDGIAKGHIVDLTAACLERHGVTDYLVNAGGDIRVGPGSETGPGWVVGIQDGSNPAKNITTVRLRSGAMATSGNYESLASRGYNHLVSTEEHDLLPRTSVTVTAPTCTRADSLATALFAMGVQKGTACISQVPSCACLWQTEGGMTTSSGWTGEAC